MKFFLSILMESIETARLLIHQDPSLWQTFQKQASRLSDQQDVDQTIKKVYKNPDPS